MTLPKHYQPADTEPRLVDFWQEAGIYQYSPQSDACVFSIDTPPPTVSGTLHLGHIYSYTHMDIIARFQRMRGCNVFYPMGFDDNGLPTERLVEKRLGITAFKVGRQAFIDQCLEVSEAAIREYRDIWQRVGLSVDWRYTYRTIDARSRRISQLSFIQLYRQGLAYRREAPAIWCPECSTSIAQADLNDIERQSEFITLAFPLDSGDVLSIATTRPELLPACVAIFVHPDDSRYTNLVHNHATVPLFGQRVPILADRAANPHKGSGAVMCCTFGDSTDVAWWYQHKLPLIQAITRQGLMAAVAGAYAGLQIVEARQQIIQELEQAGLILDRQPVLQSVRVHERCDTPVEYVIAGQWFINILDHREKLLELGEQVSWFPEHMRARYRSWVENLNWDWCISRQRYYGVPFPLWYCSNCGTEILATEDQLPIDPVERQPLGACKCGSKSFTPERDILDTWATSSMTPQIVGQWLGEHPELYGRVFPFSLRPQAHEIIRTWAFYTIVKSHYHFNQLPWRNVLISGWGLAGEGMGKISKSRGGGPMAPLDMMQRYSADAVRYWAASTGPGKDAVISEEKIQIGARLVTKLWNVARFVEPYIHQHRLSPVLSKDALPFTPADRWILARLQATVHHATQLLEVYDYATAKSEIENFFWTDLADNYLEMAKVRLYNSPSPVQEAACSTLNVLLQATIRLFAPFMPFVTEEIYQHLFRDSAPDSKLSSIHQCAWPEAEPSMDDQRFQAIGDRLVAIATAIRRYKSEHSMPLGAEINRLQLATVPHSNSPLDQATLSTALIEAELDVRGVTRARYIEVTQHLDERSTILNAGDDIQISIWA